MAPLLFRLLLLAVILYALLRGGRDERQVALICTAGFLLTALVLSPLAVRFENVETKVFMVDMAVFGGFLIVALRSYRFWPLWVAGLQLTTVLGHLLKFADSNLFPNAYGAALYFWSYPIILILAIGTWRAHRRVQSAQAAQT